MTTRQATGSARPRNRFDLGAMAQLAQLADVATPVALRVVADLGVADLLADGPRDVDDMAARTDTDPGALACVLRSLAARGVFDEVAPGCFGITPLSALLRDDHPLSMRAFLAMVPAEMEAFAALAHSVRTGEAAFEHVHGTSYYDFLAGAPEERRKVDEGMRLVTQVQLRVLAGAYDWSRHRVVVDVGGGDGSFLAGLLVRNPTLRGVVFDRPEVADVARSVVEAAGVAERCEVVSGSFFDAVPAGGDLYVIKTVLPVFDDAEVVAILRRVAAAAGRDGRVLVLNSVADTQAPTGLGRIASLQALGLVGGHDRTLAELEALLAQASLEVTAVVPSAMFPLVEAVATPAPVLSGP